jgi:hypothetical protein
MGLERNARLAELLRDPRLWTGQALAAAPASPSGYAQLDAQLPGGGWPQGALTELLLERPGIGELSLLMPALARLSAESRRIALVHPPYRVCAPAWVQHGIRLEQLLLLDSISGAEALWAAEQILRSEAFGALLLWSRSIHEKELRRLQLAAEQAQALVFLFRPCTAADQFSPAALRLRLSAGLHIEVLKSRGGRPRSFSMSLPGRGDRRPGALNSRFDSHVVVMPLSAAPAARCAG